MTLARVGRLLAVLAVVVAEFGCGDTFRPVVIPVASIPPPPASLHFAIVLSSNGLCNPPVANVPCAPGAGSRVDVSGDSIVNSANVGLNPVHGMLLPDGNAVYVANQLEDSISFYSPSNSGPVSTVTLPSGSGPTFIAASQNINIYVANSGNNTVSVISTATNVVTKTIPVGVDPVALVEMPNAQKLYVANHGSGGNGSVLSVNMVDNSVNPPIPPPAGSSWNSPTWAVARADNTRVYVLDQGTGNVASIDTNSDTVAGVVSLSAGVNFMAYDKNRDRLYVTNPVAGTMTILDASINPSGVDPLTVLASFSFSGANAPCPGGCIPVSVTALPDGSRAYVASYSTGNTCSNQSQTPPCITSWVTVINASSGTVSKTISLGVVNPSAPITVPATLQADTPVLPGCASVRFRLFAAASADSSRVLVSYCDAGATASISTQPNTSPGSMNSGDVLANEMFAPLSVCAPPGCGLTPVPNSEPLPQTPTFIIAGQ